MSMAWGSNQMHNVVCKRAPKNVIPSYQQQQQKKGREPRYK